VTHRRGEYKLSWYLGISRTLSRGSRRRAKSRLPPTEPRVLIWVFRSVRMSIFPYLGVCSDPRLKIASRIAISDSFGIIRLRCAIGTYRRRKPVRRCSGTTPDEESAG
jgi:hypothetical protein